MGENDILGVLSIPVRDSVCEWAWHRLSSRDSRFVTERSSICSLCSGYCYRSPNDSGQKATMLALIDGREPSLADESLYAVQQWSLIIDQSLIISHVQCAMYYRDAEIDVYATWYGSNSIVEASKAGGRKHPGEHTNRLWNTSIRKKGNYWICLRQT